MTALVADLQFEKLVNNIKKNMSTRSEPGKNIYESELEQRLKTYTGIGNRDNASEYFRRNNGELQQLGVNVDDTSDDRSKQRCVLGIPDKQFLNELEHFDMDCNDDDVNDFNMMTARPNREIV